MTLSRLLLLVALIGLATWWFTERPVVHGPGVVAPDAPRQGDADGKTPFDLNGYRLTPLARFALEARVLGREDYSHDREAELSPVDLALGWGPMSDEQVLTDIDIRQGGRWYRWSVREFPIPRRAIERNSANMHMIPADAAIADQLDAVRTGSVIALHGYLVEARAADDWSWRSSLTRDDTGARACELIYVERLRVVGSPRSG